MADELAKAITKLVYPVLKPAGFRRIRRREFVRRRAGIAQRLHFQVNSWGGRDFCVNVSANLIASNEFITLQPGFRLSGKADAGDLWLPSKTSNEAETSLEAILGSINEQAFPFFEKTRTVEGFSDLLAKELWGSSHHFKFQRGVAAAYLCRVDEAKKHLRDAILLYEEDDRDWCFKKAGQAKQLCEALDSGCDAKLLSEWEQKNATAHGVS